MNPNIDDILREGFQIKYQIDTLKDRLKEINEKVADQAFFKEGSKTGHLQSDFFSAKVTKSSITKWDQEKLLQIKPHFPNFNDVFKPDYKPVSKKTLELAGAASAEFKRAIDWASEIKENSPSVTYEQIQEAF